MAGQSSSKPKSKLAKAIRFGQESSGGFFSQPRLLIATDILLGSLVLIFPFIMGGREAWGHCLLISLSLLLGCVWCLYKVQTGGRFVLLSIEPLLIAGLLLVWFQTTPLQPSVLGQLSGEYSRLLENWPESQLSNTTTEPAAWSTASLYPTESSHALLILLAYGIIGVVVAQRVTSEEDCFRLLKLVGLSGVIMAAFAILQLVTSNDKFFWFYRQPYTGTREILKGAFTNRNHFAQFLSLSIGPLLWWALAGRMPRASTILQRKGLGPAQGNHSRFDNLIDPVSLLLFCALGGVILSVMLSLSRGGMVSAGIVVIVCLAGLWRSGRVKASMAIAMLGLSGIALVGLMVFGQGKIEDRVSQLASGDADKIDQMNARRTLWKADLLAIRAFPIVGTGIGSHRFVYPIYMEELAEFSGVSFSHAESSYIHLAMEGGLVGIGLLALGLLAVCARLFWHLLRRQDPARVAALTAVAASLCGGMAHAAADFIWYVPAVVVTTLILVVVGLRLCIGFRDNLGIFMPRLGWMAACAFCALTLVKVQPGLVNRITAERHWYQFLISAFEEARRDTSDPQELLADFDSEKEDAREPELTAANDANTASDIASYGDQEVEDTLARRTRILRTRINLLMASLRADPNQARTSLALADQCLTLFELMQEQNENPFSLKDIRDTVRDSQFESSDEMHDFLKRAVGKPLKLLLLSDQMTRRALALCPVQDEGYQYLVSTAFIRDPQDKSHDQFIQQAMLLGKNSVSTRYALGHALFRDGRQKEGLEQWKVAFHLKKEARLAICGILGRQFAVDVIFDEFQPSLAQLEEVLTAYEAFRRPDDIEKLLYAISERVGDPKQGLQNKAESLTDSDDTTNSENGGASKSNRKPAIGAGREKYLTLLMKAYRIAFEYQLYDQCEEMLLLAMDCDPLSESPRRAMGLLLMEQRRDYAGAEQYFEWCHEQLPGDMKLEELRRECRRLATNKAVQERRVNPAAFRRSR